MLAMDLDGTLTNSRKEVSDRNRDAVRKAAGAGVKIVLASGRPVMGQRNVVERLGLAQAGIYMLACNGSHIVEVRDGREQSLRSIGLDPDVITCLGRFAREDSCTQTGADGLS